MYISITLILDTTVIVLYNPIMVMEQLESYDTSPKPWWSHSIDGASDGVIQPGNPLSLYVYNWVVVWNIFYFPYIGNVIIPTDFHIFQRGGSTTNQLCIGFRCFFL